ncbi:MAG: hypothetical protein AB8B53_03175 [Flavobacteriales bacterium]
MSAIQRIILILAIIWIGLKLLLFYNGVAFDYFRLTLTLNFAFVAYIIFMALKAFYLSQEKKSDFIEDFKLSLRYGFQYLLIIFGFLVIYYLYIDTNFTSELAEANLVSVKETVAAEGGYEQYLENHTAEFEKELYKPGTEEEFYAELKNNFTEMVSMKLMLVFMFSGFFLMCMGVSALLSATVRKVLERSKVLQ